MTTAGGHPMTGPDSRIDTGLPAKALAAARGIKFGSFFKVSEYNADANFAALLREYSDHYVTSNSPSIVWTSANTWSWSNFDNFVSIANADGKSFRYHTVFYPPKEPAWVNPTNVTAANWMSLVDAQVAALAARPYANQFTSIDVTNETNRGDNAGDPANIYGLRLNKNAAEGGGTIPWYPAATANPFTIPGYPATTDPGLSYILYMFYRMRQSFPDAKLYFCHDQMEQLQLAKWGGFPAFSVQLQTNVLATLTELKRCGAPIDGVNLQGHLVFTRSTPATAFRTFLTNVQALGLKIIVGEFDVRSGQADGNDPANYSDFEYNRVLAEMSKRYLDTVLPFVTGGEFLTWGVTDLYQAWEAGEKPLPYDASFAPKSMLTSIRNGLMGL